MTRTKIVATLGPTTATAESVASLIDAGLSVARLNCAHGTHETLGELIAAARAAAETRAAPLALLADLAGPKLRVGKFEGGGVELENGQRFVLTTGDVLGTRERAAVNHAGLPADVKPGDSIFLNDGLLRLVVSAVRDTDIETTVEIGGWLSDRKGLSVPGSPLALPSLTEKDERDLAFAAAQGVDYVGLSFVRSAADIETLRSRLASIGSSIPIVAKIEKSQAVENLDQIIAAADAVMVARGDLGVECPIELVPLLQKRIIAACIAAGKPVITATQMLESMVNSPRPTRAEASDVANAVLDGTDAVMLSAETASGKYPVETVRIMREIIAASEAEAAWQSPAVAPPLSVGDALARSACLAATSVGADALACLTISGATARYLAKWRPRQPILALTPRREVWRQLAAVWGVQPIFTAELAPDFDAQCRQLADIARTRLHLRPGSPIVIAAGMPFRTPVHANTLRIETT